MGIGAFIKQRLEANSSQADVARVVGQLQDYVVTTFEQLAGKSAMQAVPVKGVALGTTPTNVRHTLGRRVTGWKTTRVRAPAVVSDQLDTQTVDPTVWIAMVASAPVVVDLEFF